MSNPRFRALIYQDGMLVAAVTADENGWSIAGRNGYEEMIAAIRDHYKPAADTITALTAEVERLRAALADAGRALDGAARKMKGNCSGSDVNAAMLAAGRTAEARAALTSAPASGDKT